MLFFQLEDFIQNILPMRPSVIVWRFATLGSVTNNVGNFLLLILLLYAISLVFADWRPLVFIGSITALGAVILLLSAGAFALDAVQLRSRVDPAAVSKFDMASAMALVKFVTDSILCGLIATSAFRSWGVGKREAMRERGNEDMLVVRPGLQRPSSPSPKPAIIQPEPASGEREL